MSDTSGRAQRRYTPREMFQLAFVLDVLGLLVAGGVFALDGEEVPFALLVIYFAFAQTFLIVGLIAKGVQLGMRGD